MKHLIIYCLLLFFVVNAKAQSTLSLFEAIEKALESNYDIRIKKMDEQIAVLNNSWGTAGRYPALSATVNSNNKRDFNSNDNYNQFQLVAGVNLNWVLFDGFRINITKQRLEEFEKLSNGNTAILIESTIQSIILSYNKVLLEQEKLKVYKENEQLSKDRFDYEELRKEFGNSVSYEVLQAQNAYLADKADVLLQMANVKSSKRELSLLMGEGNRDYILSDSLNAETTDYEVDDLLSAMMKNNKNLLNQYINLSIVEKGIALAKANYYPKLSVNAGAQMIETNQMFDVLPENTINSSNVFGNFTLQYNLFNGGVRKRAIQIAKIEEEISGLELDDYKLVLTNQLYNLFDFYTARISVLKLAEERLNVAKINLEISDQRLKAGTINSFNYRDVQLSYQNAAIAHLNAIYSLIDVNTSIVRLTGGIISE